MNQNQNQNTDQSPTVQQQNVNNFFESPKHAEHVNAGTVEIESARAIAEAQGKLVIAQKFPRSEQQCFLKMIESCKRLSFADQAIYSYPRAGSTVSGPSIRMAEELARNWRNVDFGTRELSRRTGESEMEAYAWDMEANVVRSIRFTVKHLRDKKGGAVPLTDERDIYEITANMAGRRVRACILAILPPDYVDSSVDECRKTIAGKNDKPMSDRIKEMLLAFKQYNVTAEMIEKRLNKKTEDIFMDELIDLSAIFNSIRDRQSEPSEWFGDNRDTKKTVQAPTLEGLKNKTAPAATKPNDDDAPIM
jgi:hypothetical protein